MSPRVVVMLMLLATGCVTHSQPESDEKTTSDSAADELRDVEISTHQYSVRLRHGDGLWLTNEHGDLRIRMSGDSGVHYAAVIQKLDGEQRDVEFPTDRQAGGLAFAIDTPSDWTGRVDASARVPEHSALNLMTTDGLLEVRTASNPVMAQSGSGAIRYRGTGQIQALSQSGDIEVALHGLNYDGSAGSILTGGDVIVWVMPGADLAVRCSAGGEMTNEVPEDVGKARVSGAKMHLDLGAATSELAIQAGGDIVLRALPLP